MKNAVLIALGALLLGLLFWWMKPAPSSAIPAASPSVSSAVGPVAKPVEPLAPPPQTVELVIRNKQRVGGPAVISVPEGTPLTLRLTSDRADELHLHGYDLSLRLPAGSPAELSFVADRSGRFEYELHHAHLELGALEVQPR